VDRSTVPVVVADDPAVAMGVHEMRCGPFVRRADTRVGCGSSAVM
jgi:hypothetical protein